jgi:proline iminopeptidase
MTETSFAAGPIAGWETGDGPALLFLHGGPGLDDYGRLISPEAAGWRFVSFQQRGLTPSTTAGPFTMEQHCADAEAVLTARGIDRAVVVGHSFGAYLALHLAVSYPERVNGLLLIDGLGVIGDGGVEALARELVARLPADALAEYRQIEAKLADEPSEDLVIKQIRLLWPSYFASSDNIIPYDPRASLAAHNGAWESVAEHQSAGFADSLAAISVPVISVLGERSPMPVSQGEQTAALIPAAEVIVVPAAGHLPWHEQPGCIAAALARLGGLTGVLDEPAA